MKRHGLAYILAGLILLAGCDSGEKANGKAKKKEEPHQLSFRHFYNPTAFDGKTRYYLYEDKLYDNGELVSTYLSSTRIERIGKDRLVYTGYEYVRDSAFAVDSSIAMIKPDGIYYEASFYPTANGWKKYHDKGPLKFISFDWPESRDVNTNIRSIPKEEAEQNKVKSMDYNGTVWFQSYGKLSDDFDGHSDYVVLGGQGTNILNGKVIDQKLTYWHLRGVGLYYYEVNIGKSIRLESKLIDVLNIYQYGMLMQ